MAFQVPDKEFFVHALVVGLVYCGFYYLNNHAFPGSTFFEPVFSLGGLLSSFYVLLFSYLLGIFLTFAGLFVVDLIFQVDDEELSEQILPWPFSGKKIFLKEIEEYLARLGCGCINPGIFGWTELLFSVSVLFSGLSMAIIFSTIDLSLGFTKIVALILLTLFLRVFGGVMKEFEPIVGAILVALLLWATHPPINQVVLFILFFFLAVIMRGLANYYLWRAFPNL